MRYFLFDASGSLTEQDSRFDDHLLVKLESVNAHGRTSSIRI